MSNRIIDTYKRPQLLELIKQLNINLKSGTYYKNEELKNIIIKNLNNNTINYIYPKVSKLVAIGDLHGDLVATIKALKLANVIDHSIPHTTRDINKIRWTGKNTVIVQLGDQIDRVRPSKTINDLCPENDPDINSDEGSDLKIICLFEKLHKEAQKVGGAVYSILGNHELMNVDGDFRYVSPKEFREFGNFFKEPYNNDSSFPYGYISRKKAFQPGGLVSKKLANSRYSVLQVGSWLFVHGGISLKCAQNFSLHDINYYVKCWLEGDCDPKTSNYIKHIYHNDDEDMSPFWTRVFSDLGDWDESRSTQEFMETLNVLNIKNKRNVNNAIKGMIVGHSPQFMYGKSINSACNNRLWRTDIGMSRAFGKLNCDNDRELRKVQVLVIENDTSFKIIKEN